MAEDHLGNVVSSPSLLVMIALWCKNKMSNNKMTHQTLRHVLHLIRQRNAFFLFHPHISYSYEMSQENVTLFLLSYIKTSSYTHDNNFIKPARHQGTENLLGLKAGVRGRAGSQEADMLCPRQHRSAGSV